MKQFLFTVFSLLLATASFSQNTPGSRLYPISDHGVWGYINQDGDVVIAPQYQHADFFYEGLASVKKEGKWGFIDSKNKQVIPLEHDTTLHFSEGWCAVGYMDEGMQLQWGYLNAAGKPIPSTDVAGLGYASNFNSHRAMVAPQGVDDPFIINHQGVKVVKQGEYFFFTDEDNNHFNEGILKVMTPTDAIGGSKTIFIDTSGKVLSQFKLEYPATGNFHEGMMWFMQDMKYGFLDRSGREVIKAQYDTVMDFSEGWAAVASKMEFNSGTMRLEGGITGYINTLGEWVMEPKARTSYSFHEGYARVLEKGKWGYMNTNGTLIMPAVYDEAEDFFRGFARAKKEGKWYYINTRGKVVWQETD